MFLRDADGRVLLQQRAAVKTRFPLRWANTCCGHPAPGDTALTRAFTGRTARGIVNRWLREHDDAPSAYPDVHHVTAKVRAAARSQDDADGFHLWAGQAHTLAEPVPAAELVRRLSDDARKALRAAAER